MCLTVLCKLYINMDSTSLEYAHVGLGIIYNKHGVHPFYNLITSRRESAVVAVMVRRRRFTGSDLHLGSVDFRPGAEIWPRQTSHLLDVFRLINQE